MTQALRVLFDTSALVAIFQPREQHHQACVETLHSVALPLITSWPVLTEAHYLLRADPEAQAKMLTLAGSESIHIADLDDAFLDWIHQFTNRYRDHDVQIADASLVWLAERHNTRTVFTLDRKDFSTYQVHGQHSVEPFEIIPEPS